MVLPSSPDPTDPPLVVAAPQRRIEIDAAVLKRLELQEIAIALTQPGTPAVDQEIERGHEID